MTFQSAKVIPIRRGNFLTTQQEEIVELAFEYWRERIGFLDGSPAQDLVRAIAEVARRFNRNNQLYGVPNHRT